MTLTEQPATAAPAITYDDVLAAAERLRGVAHRTPVVTSRTLDELVGAQGLPQGGAVPAHRRLQVPRRLQRHLLA